MIVPQDFLFPHRRCPDRPGLCLPEPGCEGRQRNCRWALPGGQRAEYVHWYAGNWGVAAFVDAGNANDERQALQDEPPATASGRAGRGSAGPIAVDLAYGQRDHRLRLRFAVARSRVLPRAVRFFRGGCRGV